MRSRSAASYEERWSLARRAHRSGAIRSSSRRSVARDGARTGDASVTPGAARRATRRRSCAAISTRRRSTRRTSCGATRRRAPAAISERRARRARCRTSARPGAARPLAHAPPSSRTVSRARTGRGARADGARARRPCAPRRTRTASHARPAVRVPGDSVDSELLFPESRRREHLCRRVHRPRRVQPRPLTAWSRRRRRGPRRHGRRPAQRESAQGAAGVIRQREGAHRGVDGKPGITVR